MTKEKIIETIKDLPADFELEALMEKLIFIDKVEKGLVEIEDGNTLTHDQVKAQINVY